jgi:hypothetical protein
MLNVSRQNPLQLETLVLNVGLGSEARVRMRILKVGALLTHIFIDFSTRKDFQDGDV